MQPASVAATCHGSLLTFYFAGKVMFLVSSCPASRCHSTVANGLSRLRSLRPSPLPPTPTPPSAHPHPHPTPRPPIPEGPLSSRGISCALRYLARSVNSIGEHPLCHCDTLAVSPGPHSSPLSSSHSPSAGPQEPALDRPFFLALHPPGPC